jgi:hypothetical protein
MTSTAAAPTRGSLTPAVFVATVFVSASLVFMVEPMMARLVLPILGGAAAVWNTSLAFFQVALLVGYIYAHALQRLASMRAQMLVHAGVLALAALSLPLGVTTALGDPPGDTAALWLVGALTLSVGAPFAALSATAPLLQAWHARVFAANGDDGPWGLYAASNLGSLLALLAYPLIVEPMITLSHQTLDWSLAYGVFVVLIATLGGMLWRAAPAHIPLEHAAGSRVTWLDRLRWVGLAAAPSSLMLGVTTYVTTDVGSAPFLWVTPLGLYLLTFIIAFQAKPLIPRPVALAIQAAALVAACAFIRPMPHAFLLGLTIHFVAFFFTALVCHQALVARRPDKGRLTEFYLFVSLGGVVGGAFNAWLAPVIFNTVVEYPAVLVLACLARPWNLGRGAPTPRLWAALVICVLLTGAAALLAHPANPGLVRWLISLGQSGDALLVTGLLLGACLAAVTLRERALMFTVAALALVYGGGRVADRVDVLHNWRGFFGVLRESRLYEPGLGGEVRMLANGTTLHGAEAVSPAFRCQPLLYYAHETPIGQVFDAESRAKPAMTVGAVGLGTGSVAAYDRASDAFTFFEINPLVARVSRDPANFSYLSRCARGGLGFVLGDARLTLGRQPADKFDVLLIDAFSSDSVPAHLLTVEAVKMYLSRIKPDGVVILHLSNRNLDLIDPAQAVALAAGGHALVQLHSRVAARPLMWESPEDAVIIARTPQGLAPFATNVRWRPVDAHGVRPWSDDYIDLFGALVRRRTSPAGRGT